MSFRKWLEVVTWEIKTNKVSNNMFDVDITTIVEFLRKLFSDNKNISLNP